MFDKCGAKKPDNATWGDIQYLFAMFYSDYFPKVLDCDQKIVKAVLAYLEDPDAPGRDGVRKVSGGAVLRR